MLKHEGAAWVPMQMATHRPAAVNDTHVIVNVETFISG
jgi:hypothetical protein